MLEVGLSEPDRMLSIDARSWLGASRSTVFEDLDTVLSSTLKDDFPKLFKDFFAIAKQKRNILVHSYFHALKVFNWAAIWTSLQETYISDT